MRKYIVAGFSSWEDVTSSYQSGECIALIKRVYKVAVKKGSSLPDHDINLSADHTTWSEYDTRLGGYAGGYMYENGVVYNWTSMSTVEINGEEFYEYELKNDWDYMPWSIKSGVQSWEGLVAFEVEEDASITVTPDSLTFDATGGTKTADVVCSNAWTASVSYVGQSGYLKQTGDSAYWVTDYKVVEGSWVEIKYQHDADVTEDSYLFNGMNMYYLAKIDSNTNKYSLTYTASLNVQTHENVPGHTYVMRFRKNGTNAIEIVDVTAGTTENYSFTGSSTCRSATNFVIGGGLNSTDATYNGKIWYVKIYEGDTLVRNYVANSNGNFVDQVTGNVAELVGDAEYVADGETQNWLSTEVGSGELNVTASNNTGESRNATITLTDSEGNTAVLNVTQKAYSAGGGRPLFFGSTEISTVSLGSIIIKSAYLGSIEVYSSGPFEGLKLTPNSLSLNNSKKSATVKIKATDGVEWSISDVPSWLTLTQTGGTGTTTITVTASETTEERTAEMTVTCGEYSETLTVSDKSLVLPEGTLININADDVDLTAKTILNTEGSEFPETISLTNPSVTEYQLVDGKTAKTFSHTNPMDISRTYDSYSDNPFMYITESTDCDEEEVNDELTIIIMCKSGAGTNPDGDSVMTVSNSYTNRNGNQNWIGNINGAFYGEPWPRAVPYDYKAYIAGSRDLCVRVLRFNGSTLNVNIYYSNDNLTEQTYQMSWQNLVGTYVGFAQHADTPVSYIYVANKCLTDAEVQAVRDYNEGKVIIS